MLRSKVPLQMLPGAAFSFQSTRNGSRPRGSLILIRGVLDAHGELHIHAEGSEIASEPQPAYCGIVRNDAEYPPITRIERGMVHLSYGINSRPLPARAISTIFNCESLSSTFRRHPVPGPSMRGCSHGGRDPCGKRCVPQGKLFT